MTSTIETNNANILKKIEYLNQICDFLAQNIKEFTTFDIIRTKIDNLLNYYSVEFAIILSDYFTLINKNTNLNKTIINSDAFSTNVSKTKEYYTKQYNQFIKRNNIPAKLDAIYNELKDFFSTYIQKTDEDILNTSTTNKIYKDAWVLFNQYKKIVIHVQIEEIKFTNMCGTCNVHMMITNVNEQSCSKCGRCQEATSYIIDEDNTSSDLKNTKCGTYDPSKHCKYWLDRIQGKEIADMSPVYDATELVRVLLNHDKIKNSDFITCELIRSYLRKANKSSMNEHVPLIRKLITGINPPQLSEQELQKVNVYFIKIIKIYNAIKPPNKINCPYHPYIIFKILEQILSNGSRKTSILRCIHLQSSQTLIWNDKIWYDIVSILQIDDANFRYVATDRNRE